MMNLVVSNQREKKLWLFMMFIFLLVGFLKSLCMGFSKLFFQRPYDDAL